MHICVQFEVPNKSTQEIIDIHVIKREPIWLPYEHLHYCPYY